MDYGKFRTPDPENENWDPIIGIDGEPLYEDVWGSLLHTIVARNDVATLNSYIAKHPKGVFAESESWQSDAFHVAAATSSTDALRVLLDHYQANPTFTKPLNTRNYSLLDVACFYSEAETVRLLLDRDPPLGKAYASDAWESSDRHGGRALLSAAQSLTDIQLSHKDETEDTQSWLRDRITCREDVINLLLDRGASVRDGDCSYEFKASNGKLRLAKTVLGEAISRASYGLVTRLLANGADVHTRQWSGNPEFEQDAFEVTPLHVGSHYWNFEGIQALLDHRGEVDLAEMVSVRDSQGRLPLHWAARGFDRHGDHVCEEGAFRIMATFKLLIENNPDTINIQDQEGGTALHHALKSHSKAHWDSCSSFEEAIRLLCENGADAGLQDNKGQGVLHIIASECNLVGATPISRAVLEMLVAYGARVNDADEDGNTALHLLARFQSKWTRLYHANAVIRAKQIETYKIMVKMMQELGGSMDQPNAAGETPQQLLEEI